MLPNDYRILPRNLKNINISGGEPFLRNDLTEIVRAVVRRCPKAKIIISTNGFLPSAIKRQMQDIVKFKMDIGIAVSLDGFGKVHEDLRGYPGGFSLVLETIRLLKNLNIKDLKLAFTLNDKNLNQLKRVYKLSKELGVEFSLAACHDSSHYFKKENNQIENTSQAGNQLDWLIKKELSSFSPKKWLRAYFAYALVHFLKTKQRILPDYSGVSSLFIDPFGKIYPSDVWDLKIGDLSDIRSWDAFAAKTEAAILSREKDRPASWMICTVRQAMKKHWLEVGWWIIRNKFLFPKNYYWQTKDSSRGSLRSYLARLARS
ncbi:MAG: hypothetical protein AVO34_02050 [Firmicutes bacterium ML8_F2]|nr:MAG: hypothetical protein AVO34_02050 [Firmicutes bacterium ML8_F2]